MILFSLGLSCGFAEWCDVVTVRLVERCLGQVTLVGANTLEELSSAVIKASSPFIVVGARQPVAKLYTAVAEANRGFIVALDDPRFALHEVVTRQGADIVEATRIVARSCASMVGCLSTPGALVLRASEYLNNPIAAAAAIAAHLQLPSTPEDLASIVDCLTESGSWPERERDARWWDQIDEARRALVDGALEGYVTFFSGGELGPIAWERDLFFIDDESKSARATRPVDITGKPRVLLYGPYISLPPGLWSANVALGFSREAAEMNYIIEVVVGADRQLTHVRIHPHKDRFVEANLSFSVDESVDQMIEVRVQSERAAFDGRLALGHVTMSPHLRARSATQDYLKEILGELT
jgi:hypothetical protein